MRSITASHSSSHEPNRPTSVAAVFAPMPGTPGSPSDGSPRSIAISAYASPARAAGTPYFSATSGGPEVLGLGQPAPDVEQPHRRRLVPHDLHEVAVAADTASTGSVRSAAHRVPMTSSAS